MPMESPLAPGTEPGAIEQAPGERVDGGKAECAAGARGVGEPARHRQRVGAFQSQAGVAAVGDQALRRLVQQHVAQAQRAVVQFDGAELAGLRIRHRRGRQVQRADPGQRRARSEAFEQAHAVRGRRPWSRFPSLFARGGGPAGDGLGRIARRKRCGRGFPACAGRRRNTSRSGCGSGPAIRFRPSRSGASRASSRCRRRFPGSRRSRGRRSARPGCAGPFRPSRAGSARRRPASRRTRRRRRSAGRPVASCARRAWPAPAPAARRCRCRRGRSGP